MITTGIFAIGASRAYYEGAMARYHGLPIDTARFEDPVEQTSYETGWKHQDELISQGRILGPTFVSEADRQQALQNWYQWHAEQHRKHQENQAIFDAFIAELCPQGLSTRAKNILSGSNIVCREDADKLTISEMMSWPNCGKITAAEIWHALHPSDPPDPAIARRIMAADALRQQLAERNLATIEATAAALGCSTKTIRHRLRRGKLQSVTIKGRKFIDLSGHRHPGTDA